MRIKPDPKVDLQTQAEIQKDMQEKVLNSSRFPEILFRSSRVEKETENRWRVDGRLSLHGITKLISVLVTRSGEAYAGRTTVRQTDFDIKPITAAGGTVRVIDESDIQFRVVTRSE
jgi:polyisoprenoid-binding protein YceI